MKNWLVMLLACLALGVVVAGCGDDDDEEPATGGGGNDTEQPADDGGGAEDDSGGEGGGGGTTVSMSNIQFEPGEISVSAGDTITFQNDEAIPHDVEKTAGPGEQFSSGPEGGMGEGDTFELTLDEPGDYEYVCRVHAPGMAGTITVE
jgi:plastocyanin